eukprot:7077636-Prymnesium_polylepis.1
MDIEFVKLRGEGEAYGLIEVRQGASRARAARAARCGAGGVCGWRVRVACAARVAPQPLSRRWC